MNNFICITSAVRRMSSCRWFYVWRKSRGERFDADIGLLQFSNTVNNKNNDFRLPISRVGVYSCSVNIVVKYGNNLIRRGEKKKKEYRGDLILPLASIRKKKEKKKEKVYIFIMESRNKFARMVTDKLVYTVFF